MITNRKVHFELKYCFPYNYSTYVTAVKNKETVSRVCYIGVQSARMFLSVQSGIPYLDCYLKDGFAWAADTKHETIVLPDVVDIKTTLQSASGFKDTLVLIFFNTYPRAEEAYYSTLPTHQEVLNEMKTCPDVRGFEEAKYVYNCNDNLVVDDADGIATITTCDGKICVPYCIKKNGVRALQVSRAKFHPDSKLEHVVNSVFDSCHVVGSKLQSITVTNILDRINKSSKLEELFR